MNFSAIVYDLQMHIYFLRQSNKDICMYICGLYIFYFPRTYANNKMCGMYLNQTKHQTAFFVASINAMLITCSDRLRSGST